MIGTNIIINFFRRKYPVMKYFRVLIRKIKGHYYIRIPDLLFKKYRLKNVTEIEIAIRNHIKSPQTSLWETEMDLFSTVSYKISSDTLTMNMRNRLYVPAKYRFFFPPSYSDFILETNAGNIQTHLTHEGYIIKGMRPWFFINSPLEEGNVITFELLDDKLKKYRLSLDTRS